jgi:hypothetical protein
MRLEENREKTVRLRRSGFPFQPKQRQRAHLPDDETRVQLRGAAPSPLILGGGAAV